MQPTKSNAPWRRYAFAQLAEQDGNPVMHLSFGKGEGELKPLNIAIPINDAIELRDALARQLDDVPA